MLTLKPNCETCDKDLTVTSKAYICSFECTYCEVCALQTHRYTCPNCSGDLQIRPIRPVSALKRYPASTKRIMKE